jgi:hypothetical protein
MIHNRIHIVMKTAALRRAYEQVEGSQFEMSLKLIKMQECTLVKLDTWQFARHVQGQNVGTNQVYTYYFDIDKCKQCQKPIQLASNPRSIVSNAIKIEAKNSELKHRHGMM